MNFYNAEEVVNIDSQHTVRLKFMYMEHTAEIVTTMGGNICGGEILESFCDLSTGLTAPVDLEVNQKHCIFEDGDRPYREVEAVVFYHPAKSPIQLDLLDAQAYLIGVEIIGFKEDRSE